jgi:hypothetical protein
MTSMRAPNFGESILATNTQNPRGDKAATRIVRS